MIAGNAPNEKVWKPTRKQELFLSLPYSILEGFYAGAVGAGKSDVLLLYPIVHQWYKNPEFKGLFLRRTFPELKEEIIPRSREYFKPTGAHYNKTDKLWTWPSGALFFFGHVELDDDVHKYDSMQPNYVAFDELTSFSEWQYLYITLQRVRTKRDSKLPAIVRSASNPGNIGHNWVRKRFIDPNKEGKVIIEAPSGIKRIFIPATIDDNPHIDPNYRKSLEALPQAEKQAKLYGDWSAYEGQVFDEFRERNYPDEPENAVHLIDSFEIPDWWPRIVVGDWGYTALTYILYGAISPTKRLYIYREQSWVKTKIEDWAGYVKEFIDKENPKSVTFCQSVIQQRGQEHTVQQQISEALGVPINLSDNSKGSRVAGKLLLHEFLRWRQKYAPKKDIPTYSTEKAQWLLRIKGLEEYKQYLESLTPPEPEDNLPKLQIFKKSPENWAIDLLPNAIRSCIYNKNHPEDVAEFSGDDPYDCLRYAVNVADAYFNESLSEFEKLKKREELLELQNRDITAFYRNMRQLDLTDEIVPVRRFHRSC